MLVLVLCICSRHAHAQQAGEYQVKAAFLFNFTRFLEWPPIAYSDSSGPFVIGILGKDPFGDHLENIVSGENVSGRNILIRRYDRISDVDHCHILYLHSNMISRENILQLKGRPVLTVSDGNNFCANGGMIRMYTENNRIRLQINVEAVKAANLAISSKLLRIAKIYD